MSEIIIRKAKESDREGISAVFKECFGEMAENEGGLDWIEGRYMVAEERTEYMDMYRHVSTRIVAVSGVIPPEQSDYNGYEVSWTGTLPEYRKRGLIVEILKKCEAGLPNDHIPLYCDCWRLANEKDVHLISVMKHLEMREVIHDRIRRIYPNNKTCNGCIYGSDGCKCLGSLFVKER